MKHIIGLNDKLTFGKYKGFTLEEIINLDLKYIDTCVNECLMELTNDAYSMYEQLMKE